MLRKRRQSETNVCVKRICNRHLNEERNGRERLKRKIEISEKQYNDKAAKAAIEECSRHHHSRKQKLNQPPSREIWTRQRAMAAFGEAS